MSFATKLCHIVYAEGRAEDVMKQPQTDTGKFSLPGERAGRVTGSWVAAASLLAANQC
jgi:hypothetical protein